MKKTKMASAIIAAALGAALLAGCTQANDNSASVSSSSGASAGSSVSASAVAASAATDVDVSFDSSDAYFDWKGGSYTTLDLSTGAQAVTKSGVYEITGTLSDGSLTVDVDKSADSGIVVLVLNNASITSATSVPIYIKDAEKVVLILEPGTTNTVHQGSAVTANTDGEPSAAVFSKADLTITGGGTLNVTSDYNDGITSKDTLKITDGTLNVQAKSDGIVGKDLLAVEKGSVTVTAGKDGLRATNDTDAGLGCILIKDGTFKVTAANDAVQVYSVLQLDGGSFDLSSGGGYTGSIKANTGFGGGMRDGQPPQANADASSAATQTTAAVNTLAGSSDNSAVSDSDSKKCLKATGAVVINGGTITASSYEDAVHSNGNLTISGGVLTLQAGDDAIHADGELAIAGGTVTIENSYEGIEGNNVTVTGGTVKLTSDDDGFNISDSAGLLTIGGGDIYVNAGGDGLDSNGSIKMTAGTVTVDGPTDSGNGAIDYNTSFDISGGTIIAAGSSGMAEPPGDGSSQPSILMYYSSAQAAGTAVTLKDEGGGTVASFTPAKQYASVAISAPGLKTGQTYTLYSGDTSVVTFTLSDTVTYLDESGVTTGRSMGQGGFQNGGQPGDGQFRGGPGGQFRGQPGSNG